VTSAPALLDGAEAVRAREVVAEIAAALAPPGPLDADPRLATASLCRGAAGVALFLGELAMVDTAYEDAAGRWLDAAVDAAAAEPVSPSLYTGTVGVGWLLGHLDGRLVDAAGAADDVDELVARCLRRDEQVIDLTDGLAGIGVYLLSRNDPGDGLDRIVAHLARLAERTADGVTWFTGTHTMLPEEVALYPAGYYSVGMAHGHAGVVALLARLHQRGVAGAGPLLADATAGLMARRRPADDEVGRYPVLVPGDGAPVRAGSRLAWCYGDPGVAVALLAAARALGDARVEAEALATARAAAARPVERSGVVDSGLCHGAAGLLHLFATLARGTGDASCTEAARRWYGVLLGQRGEGVAGFRAVFDNDRQAEPAGGFLEGAAGAGLALLAAVEPASATWDVLLLA
jgi:lantibiotic modifying enzyme